MNVSIKRACEPAAKSDGHRIMIDRIWPRGLGKAEAKADLWLKDVAPSTQLRKWYGHDPEKWIEFEKTYRTELKDNPALAELKALAKERKMTLLFAARDEKHCNAVVLQRLLSGQG